MFRKHPERAGGVMGRSGGTILIVFMILSACRESAKPPAGREEASKIPIELTPDAPSREALTEAHRLQGEANLQAIRNAVQSFREGYDRYPESLDELVASGFLEELPSAPPGTKFDYSPETGATSLVPDGKGTTTQDLPAHITPEQATEWAVSLKARADLKKVQIAVRAYEAEEGRFPPTLDALVLRGMLRELPPAPPGAAYAYDPRTGAIKLVPR